jgi:hypothetical protein
MTLPDPPRGSRLERMSLAAPHHRSSSLFFIEAIRFIEDIRGSQTMGRLSYALSIVVVTFAAVTATAITYRGTDGAGDFERDRQPVSMSGAPGGGWAAQVACGAENARDNTNWPIKIGYDFVPIATDDSLGFHVVYSSRVGTGSTIVNNVGIFLFPLVGDEVLVFGCGYGIDYRAAFDAVHDASMTDAVLRGCMGRDPATTKLRFISPHWHGDHINVEFIHAMENFGYSVVEIAYHAHDEYYIHNYYNWRPVDEAKFLVLPDGGCAEEIHSYASPLGKIWFTARSGHAPGCIDAVIDVRGNPRDRVVILGSVAGGVCPDPPAGTRQTIHAHGNTLLQTVASIIGYGCGVNPANSLTVIGGRPRLGEEVVFGLDDPTGTLAPGALAYLHSSLAPDPAVPCGTTIQLPGLPGTGEGLISLAAGDLLETILAPGVWAGPGYPLPCAYPVPLDGSLVGISVYCQGVLIDATGGPGARLVLTDAAELRIAP